MYDQVYLKTIDPDLINKLQQRDDLIKVKTEYSRDTFILSKYDIKLTFWKVSNKVTDEIYGYNQMKVSFNPHKIFNDNLHNGNDFNANDAIKTIQKVYDYLKFEKYEYRDLIVTFAEVGVNTIFKDAVNEIINNTHSVKGIPFIKDRWETNLIAGTAFKKQTHLYNKSIQLKERGHDLKSINISNDVLRYEIRLYRQELKKLGINNANDLINPKTFERIADLLSNDLDYFLIIEWNPKKGKYKDKEYKYLKERVSVSYWNELKNNCENGSVNRNKFNNELKKYNSISKTKYYINATINSKIFELKKCAIFSKENTLQKHPSNLDKQRDSIKINLNRKNTHIKGSDMYITEKCTHFNNKRVCIVTGYEIYNQSKRSKYLTELGLEWYYKNEPVLFNNLKNGFLPKDKFNEPIERQFYLIYHNIRNKANNPKRYLIKVSPIQLNLFL